MRIIAKADITLTWDDGRTVKLGTIDLKSDKNTVTCKLRQRIGWGFIRSGFWMMLPWRKWKYADESEEGCNAED